MKTHDKQALAKQFSTLFRKIAKEPTLRVSAKELKLDSYLARADLIELINQMPKERQPDPAQLMTMENGQLIEWVDNPLRIVAHFVQKWAQTEATSPAEVAAAEPTKSVKPETKEPKALAKGKSTKT